MEQKKPTKAQLERRIDGAIAFVPKDKETKSVYFSDKGIRLTVTSDTAVIETGHHKHLFDNISAMGISRPYLYTQRIVEMANENDCTTPDGYSYAKLLDVLKAKEDKMEYNIATYFSWYLQVIFDGLYSIGESEIESFIVYLDYMFVIAKNSILLSEREQDVTNKGFIEKLLENIKNYTDNINEHVILPKKTDEQLLQENIDAEMKIQTEQVINTQADGSQD